MTLQTFHGGGSGAQGPPGADGADGADGAAGAQGPPGSDAPFGRTIELLISNRESADFPGGHSYVPMSHYEDADDYIAFDLTVTVGGTMTVDILYSMSSAEAADVYFRADWSVVYDGSNPTDAATEGAPFPLTTTADVLTHLMPSSESASLSFGVFAGDEIHFRLNRLGTDEVNDTHEGDFRVISVRPLIS